MSPCTSTKSRLFFLISFGIIEPILFTLKIEYRFSWRWEGGVYIVVYTDTSSNRISIFFLCFLRQSFRFVFYVQLKYYDIRTYLWSPYLVFFSFGLFCILRVWNCFRRQGLDWALLKRGFGGGRVWRRCRVSYVTGAPNWYWHTVGKACYPCSK